MFRDYDIEGLKSGNGIRDSRRLKCRFNDAAGQEAVVAVGGSKGTGDRERK
jgi:hypothetical protein